MESTTTPAAGRRPDPRLELIQHEHELGRAYDAALILQNRLELAGLDRAAATTRGIREECAVALNALFSEKVAAADNVDIVVDSPPCQGPSTSPSGDSGSSS